MEFQNQQRLFEIAQNQMGYFTSKQAVSAGYLSKNHAYYLKQGHWIREYRSLYRLTCFPHSPEEELALWSLWSRNRDDIPEGVYSHETALTIYDVSDAMPSKLHMTVPLKFRRSADVPAILILHRAELKGEEIKKRTGYAVTTPFRTILDLIVGSSPNELVDQAMKEFRLRGLLTEREILRLVEKEPSLARNLLTQR